MKYGRIVLIHSFADSGMEARLEQIASDPDLDAVEFEHLAVIDRGRGSERIAELDRLSDDATTGVAGARDELDERRDDLLREIIYEEVEPALIELVGRFRPDLVLVHGGTIFTSATGPFLQMLIDVEEAHPGQTYALEGRSEWLIRTSGRDYHPFERRWVTNQMRWVEDNFTEDDDIRKLIEAIF